MILLITVQQPDINSLVDWRFGRTTWFLRFDTETGNWQALENPGWNNRGGAGIATAQFAADQRATAVISGEFGPNAVSALQAAGIQMIHFPQSGLTGAAVIEMFQHGELSAK
jgi:predicted Fe-Mo cluster-binding NifX family protein